ncbi:MAG: hypothetical protein AAFW69_02300 [Pseudomonadota bacterium]
MLLRILVILVALVSVPATAQEVLKPQPGDVDIDPDTWRDLVMGRTVYYSAFDEHWGREYYWPGTNRITFQHASGQCAEATWDYNPVSFEYCFYFDRPHCFRHLRRGEAIVILPTRTEPGEAPFEQLVSEITAAPFTCAPEVVS